MNDSGSSLRRERVRFRNRWSFRMSGTTSALPVRATSPVIPSPMRYRPRARSSALSILAEASMRSSSPRRRAMVPRSMPISRSRMSMTSPNRRRTFRSRTTAEEIARRTEISLEMVGFMLLASCRVNFGTARIRAAAQRRPGWVGEGRPRDLRAILAMARLRCQTMKCKTPRRTLQKM